ncbi:MAG: STAS domain-containing protein [Balneolaceae bacterium]|jgi:anti-sigma B factor antagonist|nr:STAS domain-containing protein [Balneolaceae bacterium]
MILSSRKEQDVVVYSLADDVLGGADSLVLNEAIHKAIGEGEKKFVIELGDVKFMSSTGLGMLIGAHTTIKKADAQLIIAGATEKISELFYITKLDTIFTLAGHTAAALDQLEA